MIKSINKNNVDECISVIKSSFMTIADEFGFTVENAPKFTAFATTAERLNFQLDEGRPMFAYFDNDQIIGYYSLHIIENNECELNNLCVLPEFRHAQIGSQLFSHAVQSARELGCKIMNIGIVEENAQLRKWYENFGAKHIGVKKFDFFPFTCGYMVFKL